MAVSQGSPGWKAELGFSLTWKMGHSQWQAGKQGQMKPCVTPATQGISPPVGLNLSPGHRDLGTMCKSTAHARVLSCRSLAVLSNKYLLTRNLYPRNF